jgi:hypothetical protein
MCTMYTLVFIKRWECSELEDSSKLCEANLIGERISTTHRSSLEVNPTYLLQSKQNRGFFLLKDVLL